MKAIADIVSKLLAAVVVAAAGLKGRLLLAEPAPNNDIWPYRPFLAFQIEFELGLGVWRLSGLFQKAAWLPALGRFSLFSAVSLYKGLAGAASCGCFGSVHVNPWITLVVVDVAAVVLVDDSMVRNSWEEIAPDHDAVLDSFAKLNKSLTSRKGLERR